MSFYHWGLLFHHICVFWYPHRCIFECLLFWDHIYPCIQFFLNPKSKTSWWTSQLGRSCLSKKFIYLFQKVSSVSASVTLHLLSMQTGVASSTGESSWAAATEIVAMSRNFNFIEVVYNNISQYYYQNYFFENLFKLLYF